MIVLFRIVCFYCKKTTSLILPNNYHNQQVFTWEEIYFICIWFLNNYGIWLFSICICLKFVHVEWKKMFLFELDIDVVWFFASNGEKIFEMFLIANILTKTNMKNGWTCAIVWACCHGLMICAHSCVSWCICQLMC